MVSMMTHAIAATLDAGQKRMADAIGRRLGAPVTFAGWQKSTRKGGPESPLFAVPAEHVGRAAEFGLDAFQFVAR